MILQTQTEFVMTKNAVLFGGMDNFNEAICLRLSALGYRGLLIGVFDADCRRRWDDVMANGCHFQAVTCDATDHESISELSKCMPCFGYDTDMPDLLIINDAVPIKKNNDEFVQYVANRMHARNRGRVIHLAPMEVPDADVNKRDVASLFLNKPITLNTICPGFIGKTAWMSRTDGDESAKSSSEYQTKQAEIINLITYLISDEATGIDGARIAMNAGRYLT